MSEPAAPHPERIAGPISGRYVFPGAGPNAENSGSRTAPAVIREATAWVRNNIVTLYLRDIKMSMD